MVLGITLALSLMKIPGWKTSYFSLVTTSETKFESALAKKALTPRGTCEKLHRNIKYSSWYGINTCVELCDLCDCWLNTQPDDVMSTDRCRNRNRCCFLLLVLLLKDRPPAIVVDDILAQFLAQLAKYQLFIEEFTLVPMFEIFRNALPHISRQFAIGHILLHLFDLLPILPPAGVQALY